MKISCLHGYFIFNETEAGQISKFVSRYDLPISLNGDHYTFDDLVDAPKYSIAGSTYLGAVATTTYEGEPWEVMRQNNLIYNFSTGLVEPIATIVQSFNLSTAGNYFVSNGLIVPGSVTDDGSRVKDYSALYSSKELRFKYSEVGFE